MSGAFASPRGRRTALVAVAALAAGTVGAVSTTPANGTVINVRPGKSISVFHNLDFVAISGYGPFGRDVTVRVLRNGVTIGSVTAPTTFLPGGLAGLEINHGPETAPFPGDCWDGHTPDIRPGDHIVVTDGAGRDEVVVDDIAFTGDPSEAPDGDVVVPFRAFYANGTAIPLGNIDSAEFRLDQLRYEPDAIAVEPQPGGVDGEYQMRYESTPEFTPSRTTDDSEDPADPEDVPMTQAQIRAALLGDGHTIGFGHVDPVPAETMLVEGVGDTPGAAPGCEGLAPFATSALTTATPSVINAGTPADRPLRVSGFSQGASEVAVRLTAGNAEVVKTADVTGTDRQTWRTSFSAQEMASLSGNIRVAAVVDGTVLSGPKTVLKDTDVPNAPSASLAAGTYRRAQRVSLSAGASDRIRYTIGDGRQAAPTRSSGRVYRGGDITIGFTSTLKMVATDGAGNVSPVRSTRYTIRRAPSSPRIGKAAAGARGGDGTAIARWAAPASMNGSRLTGFRVAALKLRPTGTVASRSWSKVLPRSARSWEMRLPEGRFRFAVRALSNLGVSRLSAASNAVRPR
jgi:hypothetical protein